MAQAEKHGFKVQTMWRNVQSKTTRANFGTALRKMLLSGTEWVQSLSSRPTVATEKGGEHGEHSLDGKWLAVQREKRVDFRGRAEAEGSGCWGRWLRGHAWPRDASRASMPAAAFALSLAEVPGVFHRRDAAEARERQAERLTDWSCEVESHFADEPPQGLDDGKRSAAFVRRAKRARGQRVGGGVGRGRWV